MNLIDPTITHDKTCILHYSCKGQCTCDYDERQKAAQACAQMLIPMAEYDSLKQDRVDMSDLLENAAHTIDLLLDKHEDAISTDIARELAKKEAKKINDFLNARLGKQAT
jgi:hypothetical protein